MTKTSEIRTNYVEFMCNYYGLWVQIGTMLRIK
jgi:hypothetical protein